METSNPPATDSPVRILIVDDHPNTAATLARAVSQVKDGIEVLSADSGERALALAQEKAADLLITDMMMPGMNGLELIEKLNSIPGGRPSYTVLITAYDVPGLRETARRLKVNEVIIKPIRPERICQIAATALGTLGSADAAPIVEEVKQKAKILITDDLPDNVALLSRYLQSEGYLCITASNGIEALAKTRSDMPDLVLLDINMPGKDGFETLQEIRTDPAIGHIPVIFLTARMEPMDMQSALNMGADDYVTKPFDRRELLARIRTRLRVKEAEDVMRRRNKELNLLPEIGKELSARLDIDELGDIVLRRTTEAMGALLGHMALLKPDGSLQKTYHFIALSSVSLKGEAKLPSLKTLLAQIKETRQGITINDTHTDTRWPASADDPTRSVVIAPMFGRYDLLGLLILAHEKTGYFSMEHKLLLQAIASQAAIALENAQLHVSKVSGQDAGLPAFQKPVQAALLFEKTGKLLWLTPDNRNILSNFSLSIGTTLARGDGFDPLLKLLEDVRKSSSPATGEILWPDGRMYFASLLPMENGNILVLLSTASGSSSVPSQTPAVQAPVTEKRGSLL